MTSTAFGNSLRELFEAALAHEADEEVRQQQAADKRRARRRNRSDEAKPRHRNAPPPSTAAQQIVDALAPAQARLAHARRRATASALLRLLLLRFFELLQRDLDASACAPSRPLPSAADRCRDWPRDRLEPLLAARAAGKPRIEQREQHAADAADGEHEGRDGKQKGEIIDGPSAAPGVRPRQARRRAASPRRSSGRDPRSPDGRCRSSDAGR